MKPYSHKTACSPSPDDNYFYLRRMNYIFDLNMKGRDYECDLQGIVNNANYQHYIEHTRHEFLLSRGISFAELHEKGIDAVWHD